MFKLVSDYEPTGDQPQAIDRLVEGIKKGYRFQTLIGVTGSGKTFTMANVISRLNRPALVISPNKTLAAQLYGEFKHSFPTIESSTLSAIMITINLKLMFQQKIFT